MQKLNFHLGLFVISSLLICVSSFGDVVCRPSPPSKVKPLSALRYFRKDAQQPLALNASSKALMNVSLRYHDYNQSAKEIANLTVPVYVDSNGIIGAECKGTFDGIPLCISIDGVIFRGSGELAKFTRYLSELEVSTNVTSCEALDDVIESAQTAVALPIRQAPEHLLWIDTGLKRFGNYGDDKDPRTRFQARIIFKVLP